MFSIKYNEIDPFVTPQADVVMRNIHGDDYYGDQSVMAAMRALLFERLDANEEFVVRMNTITVNNMFDMSTTELLDYVFRGPQNNSYNITDIIDPKVFKKASDMLTAHALSCDSKYALTELQRISDYLHSKVNLDARIFINEANGAAYIMVNGLSVRYLHLISSLIPKYLPKFFVNKPLKPYERAMLETMTRQRGSDFLNAISVVGEHMDLREAFLRNMVIDFEKREMARMLQCAKTRLADIQHEIEMAMTRYANAIRQRREQQIRIEGLTVGVANTSDNSDLFQYLLSNKNVEVLRVDGSKMEIEIRTHLDIFDTEIWQHYANNGSIFTINGVVPDAFKQAEDRKLFFNALFGEDPLISLKVRGYYTLSIDGECGTSRTHVFKAACNDYFTNPHLGYHACLGENRTQISEQLAQGEIIGAIECAIASCKSINLAETSQTLSPMMKDILNSTAKIIKTADGVDMTPAEALKWLKERKNQ